MKEYQKVSIALSSTARRFSRAIEANNPDDIQTAIHVVEACLAEMQEIQNRIDFHKATGCVLADKAA